MIKTKDIPAVLIRWKDARGCSANWEPYETGQEMELCEIWSFGFLIHECEERLVVAPHMEIKGDTDVSGTMSIPAVNVIEKRILDLTPARTEK